MRFPKAYAVFICFVLLLSAAVVLAADHKFVGVSTCKMCHKGETKGSQFEIWEASKHAKAIEGLKTEEALKIAKEKGLKVPPSEAPECLKCHMTGFGVDASLLDAKFDKTQGVQCESCHGAGGDYKNLTIMKDRAKAIEAGLNAIAVADGTAGKLCVKCHNSESPTFKSFNFAEFWGKIKHPRPKS